MFQPFRQFLETELNNGFDLQPRPIPPGLEVKVSDRGKNRVIIQNWCYSCTQLRKIRYTYIDAGATGQTFTSVIYPDYRYDLPILSLDCLALGRQKILVALDFQPLWGNLRSRSSEANRQYHNRYIEPMAPIWAKYPQLHQNLKRRWYEPNKYFSKYLIFANTDPETVAYCFFPAYREYLRLYWRLVEQSQPLQEEKLEIVFQAQSAYDQYHAERDPSGGMLTSYFGHQWAKRFETEFLFELAAPQQRCISLNR